MAYQLAGYTIRNFTPDAWPAYRALRLRALEDAPDAFGSTLADESVRPPEEWAARLARRPKNGRRAWRVRPRPASTIHW